MHYLDLFSDDDVAKDWKEGEDSRHCGLAVDDQEGDMVDLETIGKVSDPSPTGVSMCDNDYFVTAIDQLGRQLVYVTLDSSGLREEEVTDHTVLPFLLAEGLMKGPDLRTQCYRAS